ncbi:MazG-like family protein [Natronosporangium hydrolyticum]|uniref:MazG-like family protein n=2 Tax=Natronosporangium hydrolyticum TaxID=2811111 RepID=A0A895YRQ7_9ACTN|nr:MazG-like family protein [Natronosporangium hydrolyticum]QSB17486.1 MazG-like family protein [Natronosporangium hydrolyticum]
MRAVRAAVAWLDEHQGTGREQQTIRILKLTEEAGEAARAWIGATGQNPRHAVTHSVDDVAAELADTAITALVAIESLGCDANQVMADCAAKILARIGRSPAGVD